MGNIPRSAFLVAAFVAVIATVGYVANFLQIVPSVTVVVKFLVDKYPNALATVLLLFVLLILVISLAYFFRGLEFERTRQKLSDSKDEAGELKRQIAAKDADCLNHLQDISKLRLELERASQPTRSYVTLRKEFEATIRTIDEVVKLLDTNEPQFKFTRINETLTIEADGTASVETDYEIEAGDKPAKLWNRKILADNSAADATTLSDIDLRVSAVAKQPGEDIRYLLRKNSKREKQLSIFFLPEIPPRHSRRFRLSYSWSKFAGDLISKGETIFFSYFKSPDASDTADVVYELRFSKDIGSLACELTSHADGNYLHEAHNQKFWVWRFVDPNMKVAGTQIEIKVSRLDAVLASGTDHEQLRISQWAASQPSE